MTKKYFPTIGLEIHAELATDSKMFCGCKNDPFVDTQNLYICPVCTAQPGAIPVPNKKAIESMIKIGLAVGGTIADYTEFDRKSYFYPDIPKGYQISQYKYPIVSGGELAGVKLTRIHLEEDTGTSEHHGDHSLINYNRAGVPLMELVTEPVIHDAETAMKFAKELQLLLRTLGVAHANMEKGEMRVEVNISVSDDPRTLGLNHSEGMIGRTGNPVLGTKVEVKNIASISFAGKAIAYEIARMTELLEAGRGNKIVQETRGWDDAKQKTFSQRKKEGSADYRYFPDPDIPSFKLHSLFDLEKIKSELPELPWQKRSRYASLKLKSEDIERYIADAQLGEYFDRLVLALTSPTAEKLDEQVLLASNYVANDLVGSGKPVAAFLCPKALAEIIDLVSKNELGSRSAKDLILELDTHFTDSVRELAEQKGILQKNDPDALRALAEKVLAENPKVVEQIKGGKETAIMSLVGQIMRETKGSANPQLVQEILKNLIQKQ